MILLATDLDQTLVGNAVAMKQFFSKIKPLRKTGGLKLIYATGRSYQSYINLKNEHHVISPDILVCALGTEIYFDDNQDYDWPNIYLTTDWNPETIISLCKKMRFTFQEQPAQSKYKISFYGNEDSESMIIELKNELKKIAPSAIILSSHAGQFIDISPAGGDKGAAIKYITRKLDIDDALTIVAGDSLNDASLFKAGKSIVVGNAYKEVHDWFAKSKDLEVYFASKKFAAGISEGLDYYLNPNYSN